MAEPPRPPPEPGASGAIVHVAAAAESTGLATRRRGVRGGLAGWVGARLDYAVARVLDLRARRGAILEQEGETALTRVGGPVARWVSFPRGVRSVTAGMAMTGAACALWGLAALVGAANFPFALLAGAAGFAIASASAPIGVRLANRLHRLISRQRRFRVFELRGVPDRRAVAVRGVVLGRRVTTSPMDERAVVWSLTRFRLGRPPLSRAFFHEVAFDFLIDDGTDEPIWVEVTGGMVIDRFPHDRRVQFQSTTLLEIDHPFLTHLRLRDRKVRAAEIAIAPGDIVDVVGRLSRRLDPSAPSDSGREPPQRRALRSGTRVPVMVRKVMEPDSRARARAAPRGARDAGGRPGRAPAAPVLRRGGPSRAGVTGAARPAGRRRPRR